MSLRKGRARLFSNTLQCGSTATRPGFTGGFLTARCSTSLFWICAAIGPPTATTGRNAKAQKRCFSAPTGDIHYTSANFYDPEKAQFKDFDPFWEFVAGPLNAGTYGPNSVDNTFGIQVVFQKAPARNADNSPRAGLQFFGEVMIEAQTGILTVNLRDLDGNVVFTKALS